MGGLAILSAVGPCPTNTINILRCTPYDPPQAAEDIDEAAVKIQGMYRQASARNEMRRRRSDQQERERQELLSEEEEESRARAALEAELW
eukprot:NODE_4528_length_344_cov_393.145763_g3924_i0.p2 GENE.NODE_4528_length_344_cov_393.145763_g3924_i0~~NODE_4528_length_344_cov_393.145763_g3924_i0.p2  ORF type:complete len:99 (+),score=32.19 NODE_4528_length_344_cov_393.145763_g3924_i0:30-299(+)